jgi:hypothetical protein
MFPAWICAAAIGQTNTYHPFPDSNAVWMGHHWPGLINCGEHYAYIISGDTSVGGQGYHKLAVPYVNSYGGCAVFHSPGYAGCFRQDLGARKVFWLPPGAVDEELLYDFSLHVCDTMAGFSRLGCSQPASEITLMDSVLIGSTYRRQWHCGAFPSTNVLIEGIGFISGVLEGCATGMPDGPFNVLDCFQQDGVSLYPDGPTNCDLQNSTAEPSSSSVSLTAYPDPFTERTTVNAGRHLANATLAVYNSLGQEVCRMERVHGATFVLQRNDLPAGGYLIALWESGRFLGTAKLLMADQ